MGKGKPPLELRKTNLKILSTFADASLDMPIHRYTEFKLWQALFRALYLNTSLFRFRTFLNKLVVCLGERDYLWVLALLLMQAVGKKKIYLAEEGGADGKVAKSIKLQQVSEYCISSTTDL